MHANATQIHLTYISPTEVTVSWVTGDSIVAARLPPPLPVHVASAVQWGLHSGNYTSDAAGLSTAYTYLYTFANELPNYTYSSGIIHHTRLTGAHCREPVRNQHMPMHAWIRRGMHGESCGSHPGLQPATTYSYRVGDPNILWSQELNFTTMPLVGTFPFRLGVIADLVRSLYAVPAVPADDLGMPCRLAIAPASGCSISLPCLCSGESCPWLKAACCIPLATCCAACKMPLARNWRIALLSRTACDSCAESRVCLHACRARRLTAA